MKEFNNSPSKSKLRTTYYWPSSGNRQNIKNFTLHTSVRSSLNHYL